MYVCMYVCIQSELRFESELTAEAALLWTVKATETTERVGGWQRLLANAAYSGRKPRESAANEWNQN